MIVVLFILIPVKDLNAQAGIVKLIQEATKKVILAVDLRIQFLQTKTMRLQNVQKAVENDLSQVMLADIGELLEKQKCLYDNYYHELWEVKSVITSYERVKDVTEKEIHLVNDYKQAIALIREDSNFSKDEIDYICMVYGGILTESANNLEQIKNVVNAFTTQMNDAERLSIINKAADEIDKDLSDFKQFTNESMMISIQRAKESNDIDAVRRLYSIP